MKRLFSPSKKLGYFSIPVAIYNQKMAATIDIESGGHCIAILRVVVVRRTISVHIAKVVGVVGIRKREIPYFLFIILLIHFDIFYIFSLCLVLHPKSISFRLLLNLPNLEKYYLPALSSQENYFLLLYIHIQLKP